MNIKKGYHCIVLYTVSNTLYVRIVYGEYQFAISKQQALIH